MQNLQQAIAKTPALSVQDIPYDAAWVEGSKLEGCVRTEREGATVFTGVHPEHGNIHIVIPPVGNGLLLFPFATH